MSTNPSTPRASVPTPGQIAAKNRRRPALIALALAFLLLSALAGWWAFTQISTTTSVIGVKQPIARGEVIEREDLVSMEVSKDPNLSTVPVEEIDQVVGRRAATDLPVGVTVPRDAFSDALVPPRGRAVIGVVTAAGFAPRTGLVKGARVTLVPLTGSGPASDASGAPTPEDPASQSTPGASTSPGGTGSVPPSEGAVEGTVVDWVDTGDGASRIDIEVDATLAPELQRRAAENKLAVVVESQER
ncbi:MAG: SAF domain-containing protein [Propionibacteriales bacterium]|nr:SAF domain-containing protein [Propionibacteriales bacterium]